VFLALLINSILNQNGAHFMIGTLVALVGSFVGFCTMVALGF